MFQSSFTTTPIVYRSISSPTVFNNSLTAPVTHVPSFNSNTVKVVPNAPEWVKSSSSFCLMNDCDTIMKDLASTLGQNSSECIIDENSYKITGLYKKCKIPVEFTVNVYKKNSNNSHIIEFTKQSGESCDFYTLFQHVSKILNGKDIDNVEECKTIHILSTPNMDDFEFEDDDEEEDIFSIYQNICNKNSEDNNGNIDNSYDRLVNIIQCMNNCNTMTTQVIINYLDECNTLLACCERANKLYQSNTNDVQIFLTKLQDILACVTNDHNPISYKHVLVLKLYSLLCRNECYKSLIRNDSKIKAIIEKIYSRSSNTVFAVDCKPVCDDLYNIISPEYKIEASYNNNEIF